MGLLSGLFKRKNNESRETLVRYEGSCKETRSRSCLSIQGIDIHPDIADLLWIENGPHKNISKEDYETCSFVSGDLVITLTFGCNLNSDPSKINTKARIDKDADRLSVERPPYYPRYKELSPSQKGIYLRYLSNPYDGSYDVGYAFLLYYGLERHLVGGNLEKAFDVILKMRDVFANKAFQTYTANALILTSVVHRRRDLLEKFVSSLDKEYEFNFSRNLLVMCKAVLQQPLCAKEAMIVARGIPGANLNYIRKYPDIFEEQLNRVNPEGIAVSISSPSKLPMDKVSVFANTSLYDKVIEVPDFLLDMEVLVPLKEALSSAHEATKKVLADLRKKGDMQEVAVQRNTPKPIDFHEEQDLKKQLEEAERITAKHFALLSLQNFYYRHREAKSEYLQMCMDLCYEDISLLPQLQREHHKEVPNDPCFMGRISSFERLAIIYEKKGELDEAKKISKQALSYYLSYDLYEHAQDFIKRLERLEKKIEKTR